MAGPLPTVPSSPPAPVRAALSSLRVGDVAVVREANVDAADASYLRAMGLRPGARVRVCRLGEPVIVEVMGCGLEGCGTGGCGCRIGLSREIAKLVMVDVGDGPGDGR